MSDGHRIGDKRIHPIAHPQGDAGIALARRRGDAPFVASRRANVAASFSFISPSVRPPIARRRFRAAAVGRCSRPAAASSHRAPIHRRPRAASGLATNGKEDGSWPSPASNRQGLRRQAIAWLRPRSFERNILRSWKRPCAFHAVRRGECSKSSAQASATTAILAQRIAERISGASGRFMRRCDSRNRRDVLRR